MRCLKRLPGAAIAIMLLLNALPTVAQTGKRISGRVYNSSNDPLQGVSVQVKGSSVYATTDANGRFTINAPADTATLILSFVGFSNKEIPAGITMPVDVVLTSAASVMSDVVVVGYGKQKKVNLTGAVASINGDQLTNRPVTTISAGLQGQLPGVAVIQQSGQPGRDGAIIRVRGVGTMNDAGPMVVVDGIISGMDDLNPNDIASVSVLKDASASAIYGSRAANGVILVTTKRGKAGTPKVAYNGYVGWQKLTNQPKYLDSYDYAVLLNEGLKNEGASPRYTDEELQKFKSGSDPVNYPNTNWLDLLYQGSGFQQSHNVSMTGGTESSRYMLSLGYLGQDGLITNTNSRRYNVRFNLDSKISERFSAGVTTSLSQQAINEPAGVATRTGLGELIRQANRIPPTVLNKYPDGTWGRHIDGNPIAWAEDGGLMKDNVSHALGDVFGELTIIRGLKLRGSAGIDFNYLDRKTQLKDITYGDGSYQGPNSIADVNDRSMRTILQALLTYQRSFYQHNLSVLAGTSREALTFRDDNASRINFPNNDLTDLNAGATQGMANSGYSYQTRLGSYFGRANYDYAGKYLLELSVRYDGSSKFAEEKRWGLFPSFSAGWRVSQENFMKDVSFINDLKVRGSYGTVGNNSTGDYQYIPKISLGQTYPFGGTISPGAAQTTDANENLQWEKTTKLDVGVDVAFFKNKLTISADYYDDYTDNILTPVPVTSIYGLPAPTVNAGAMRNKGFEFLIGHSNTIGNFSYNASFNIGFNKNRVEKFANPAKSWRIQAEGYEWNAFYGYQYIGLYQTDDEVKNAPKVAGTPVQKGDMMFKDQNGDGKIDGDDRVVLGSDVPAITFGLNAGAKYKNIDLSFLVQGAAKVTQVLNNEVLFPFYNGAKAQDMHLDRWTPETPNARFPLTHVNQTYNYDQLSSFNAVNAAYIRMKNLQVGYTFTSQLLAPIKINQIRVYASAQNLFTITKLKNGFDPESQVDAQYRYPNVKIYTVGLNVNF